MPRGSCSKSRQTRPAAKQRGRSGPASHKERETISRGLAQKKALTVIAAELGRAVSTVSRRWAATVDLMVTGPLERIG